MDDFYATIKEISKKKKELPNEKEILEKHKHEIFNLITDDYKVNIQNAVNSGSDEAYLCLYITTAKIKNVIHIHDILAETDVIKEKSRLYSVQSLKMDIEKFFHPFKVRLDIMDNLNAAALIVSWN
jgi:hypothetical protein